MSEERIVQFMGFSPHQFEYVIRHDWWHRYPIDEVGSRQELELWLCCTAIPERGKILKIRCFHASSLALSQEELFRCFEKKLHIGIISTREQQWENYSYAFIDSDTNTKLFGCQRFDVWCDNDK